MDLDYATVDPKSDQKSSATTDGVVPVQNNFEPFAYGYKYNSQPQMSHSVRTI
jgi:hypothetical protein